jgi:hypothetical protein
LATNESPQASQRRKSKSVLLNSERIGASSIGVFSHTGQTTLEGDTVV